jgi:elongation factor G
MTHGKFIIEVAVSPRTAEDREKLAQAIARINRKDAEIQAYTEPNSDRIVFAAMNELDLQTIIGRLQHEYSVNADVSEPQIIYREGIRGKAEAEGKYMRQTGSIGNFAYVKIRLSPNQPGQGYEFRVDTEGDAIPIEYISSVDEGIREAMFAGIRAGYEMVDVQVSLLGGTHHDSDSNKLAFKIAGAMAFKEAARKAKPVILEPMMMLEVVVPEEYMGSIIGDLNSRRGRIENLEMNGRERRISAIVPLSTMHGYAAQIRHIGPWKSNSFAVAIQELRIFATSQLTFPQTGFAATSTTRAPDQFRTCRNGDFAGTSSQKSLRLMSWKRLTSSAT